MFEDSGIRRPEGYKRKIKQVKPGIYVVENPYEGEYVYFEKDNFPSHELSSDSLDETVKSSLQLPEDVSLEKMRQILGTDAPARSTKPQVREEIPESVDVGV